MAQLRTMNFHPAERHAKHNNLNKMKRHKNIQQVKNMIKKKKKKPPNQTKEEDIVSLPEKENRIMIEKMIQNLETKWSCR